MSLTVPWNSQPLKEWGNKYAKGKFVEIDGLQTHYIEKGDGDAVIFIHGFFYDSFQWIKNIDAFAKKYKVYAIDLWGFGYSSREPLDYCYQLYVDQILKFMDNIGLEKATLIGQSMGGGTAIRFSVLNKDRVNKIILVDPAGMPMSLPPGTTLFLKTNMGERLFNLDNDFIRKSMLRWGWIHDKSMVTQDYFDNVTRFHKIKGTTEVLMSIMKKQYLDKLYDDIVRLGQMDVPRLLVWGEQDKGIPLTLGLEMNKLINSTQFEIFSPAGHVPNYEQADEFNRVALKFLAS